MSNPGTRTWKTSATTPEAVSARVDNAPHMTIGELPEQMKKRQGDVKKGRKGNPKKNDGIVEEDNPIHSLLPGAQGNPGQNESQSSASVTASENRENRSAPEMIAPVMTEATQIKESRVESPKKIYDSQPKFEASASSIGAATRAQAKPQPAMMARHSKSPQKQKPNKEKASEEDREQWEETETAKMQADEELAKKLARLTGKASRTSKEWTRRTRKKEDPKNS